MNPIEIPCPLTHATTEELFETVSGLLKEMQWAPGFTLNDKKYQLVPELDIYWLEMAFSILRYKVEGNSNGWSIPPNKDLI